MPQPKASLTRRTLLTLASSIGVVIVATTAIGYLCLVSSYTNKTLEKVKKYVILRTEREREIFSLAMDDHVIFKQAILDRFKTVGNFDAQAEFDRRVVRFPDGTMRNRLEGFDYRKTPGVFLGKNVTINTDIQRRVVTYFDLISAYGPAWSNRFVNTYLQIPENGIVIYFPTQPWAQQAPSVPSFRVTDDESFYITDKAHNPERKTVWTGIYYDQVAHAWMASCVTPIDLNGRHIATFGHDILIGQLRDRAFRDHPIAGTYNIVFRRDGRLIVHPELMDQIQQGAGKFDIEQSNNIHLKKIFALVKNNPPQNVIIDNPHQDEYLAVQNLGEPDWFFITVVPKSILAQQALEAARFILLLGIASLLIEIAIVAWILRRQIAQPLTDFMQATESIASGDLNIELDTTRQDELGRLAMLFHSMARQVEAREKNLKQAEAEAKRLQLMEAETRRRVEVLNQTLESTVNERTAYLNAIIDNLADGLLVVDSNCYIARCNPALLGIFGFSADDLQGQSCQTRFSDEVIQLIERSHQKPTENFVAEMTLSDGRIVKAVATAILKNLKDEDGSDSFNTADRYIGSVVLIRDITDDKAMDQMKTDFISTVSHELRTPLTSVLGFAKIIKKKLEEALFPLIQTEDKKVQRNVRQVQENIDIIISEGERLTALINDVLDIAKMEAGKVEWKMEPLSIKEVVERAITATTALFQDKGLELMTNIGADLPMVMGDRDRLIQVVINLISNAVKFTDSGSVTCEVIESDGEILVSVIDTGSGISLPDQEKVFEKFKQVGDTLTDKPKGTGLGLPICKQIVECHQGRIWVKSEPGKGSNFSFALPVSAAIATSPKTFEIEKLLQRLKEHVVTSAPETERKKTVLVVDDDVHIRQLLRQHLEADGYQIEEARDGREAIAQVKQARPDLIVLDVMMPEIGGFDVAAILKNDPDTMNIPIVLLSVVEDKERGYRIGVDRYLTKPIDTDLLLKEIGILIHQGPLKRKALVVDENETTVRTLVQFLQTKEFNVVGALNDQDFLEKVASIKPDVIIANLGFWKQFTEAKALRFEKDLENVLFFLLADNTEDGSNQP
ncbi:MAG: response regulator [Scytolyngbya sp. HA4215-MV1]|nr:response regulator [Scytolyngbya sp. HA4215-MV1]